MMPATDNFDEWVQRANVVQAELAEARSRLLTTELTGASGPVTLTLSAAGDLRDVHIDADRMVDLTELGRDILLAHERAKEAIRTVAEEVMRPLNALVGGLEDQPR